MSLKILSGNKPYKNTQIPINAKVLVSPKGKEFYLSGASLEGGTIKLIESNEFIQVDELQLAKILTMLKKC